MLKMIICDDDKIFCSSFEDLVIEICRERNLKYEIFMFYVTTKLKKFLEDNNDIDLIFLDIELKKILGYELGSYIRNVLNLQKIDIVYISNNSSYAMALFKTRPIDFLIKPIKKEDLRNVLDQYLKLNKEKKEFFKFKNKIGYQRIDVQDIYYFESENKIVKIHCINNIIKFYGKLNDVEQKLNDSFIRIHSSILVNTVYIAQFKYNEVKMINGELLPISQSRRQDIRKKQMDRWENNS